MRILRIHAMTEDNRCCESCCCCCCHGNVNLVSVIAHVGAWMISIGIISCIFGFTALAGAKDLAAFKVTAMLCCALGIPTCLGAFYVNKRVRSLTDGDAQYLRTRDALFDVFVCTGALLILLGFIFMTIGFAVNSPNVVLAYIGVMGTIQFVVGMFDILVIRVWVRGSQPCSRRGNIIDIILDLRYPVVVLETTLYEPSGAATVSEVYGPNLPEPIVVNGNETEVVQYHNGQLRVILMPLAPPTYEVAISSTTDRTANNETNDVQFEPPPPYQLTA